MTFLYANLIQSDELDSPKQKRFLCYKFDTWYTHGFLGMGNRRQLNKCIENEIKDLFPNNNGGAFVQYADV